MSILSLTLMIILAIAAATDILYHKIPNAVTIPAVVFGLLFHFLSGGISGLLFSTGGMVMGAGFLLLFYAADMMGAGDVKLMAAVGSMLGPVDVFRAFLFVAVTGGVYAVVVLAVKRQLSDFLKRVIRSMMLSVWNQRPAILPAENRDSVVLCYGIAIGVGTIASLLLKSH